MLNFPFGNQQVYSQKKLNHLELKCLKGDETNMKFWKFVSIQGNITFT